MKGLLMKPIQETENELLAFPKDYTIVDLETTGLSYETDFIIEVGAIKIRNQKPVQEFSTFVHSPILLDEKVISLTGITDQMLQSAPLFDEIAEDLWNFIGNDIIIGHNIGFDASFLYHCFFALDQRIFLNKYVDTLPISKKLFPELIHHRLIDMAAYYKISTSNAHRALADCTMNYHVFECMKETVIKTYGSFDLFFSKWNQLETRLRASSVSPTTDSFYKEHPLYGKNCVITGALDRFSRKEAMQHIANCGGHNMDKLNTYTNVLIIGNFNYCNIITGITKKHKKALRLINEGHSIQILTEQDFYGIAFKKP